MTSISFIAKSYYQELNNKNIEGLKQYLDDNIHLIGPMSVIINNKSDFLEAAENFMNIFDSLKVRKIFVDDHDNNAVVIIDFICPPPIKIAKSASLLTINNNLITTIELFYDKATLQKTEQKVTTQL